MRGGTEPVHNIAGSFQAYKEYFENRSRKNSQLGKMRDSIKKQLESRFKCVYLESYESNISDDYKIVYISPKEMNIVMPHVLLIGVVGPNEQPICGGLIREKLEEKNIIVSVGSACNSSSDSASHVVQAMCVPEELQPSIVLQKNY